MKQEPLYQTHHSRPSPYLIPSTIVRLRRRQV
nr:MAG TPA: hypothetical protein [Caudoviricetes sp.]